MNLLDAGVVSPYTMSEMDLRSRTWVQRLYAYKRIREEVRIAQAA